jgi:hypothetical protein
MLQSVTLQQVEAAFWPSANFPCYRHPELVSGSTLPPAMSALVARWMLKQVQLDGVN